MFSFFGNVTTLFSDFNDTLYKVGNNRKLQPEYLIDYGNNNQQLSTKFVNTIGPLPTDFEKNSQLRAYSGIFQLSRQLQTNSHFHLTGIKDMKLFSLAVNEAFKKPGEELYNDYPEVLKNALLKAETNSNPILLVWEISSF